MDTSFKVSITVLTHPRYSTCRASGLVQIPLTLIDSSAASNRESAGLPSAFYHLAVVGCFEFIWVIEAKTAHYPSGKSLD
jgi:hypothetical protein